MMHVYMYECVQFTFVCKALKNTIIGWIVITFSTYINVLLRLKLLVNMVITFCLSYILTPPDPCVAILQSSTRCFQTFPHQPCTI